jgi:hypothetical protein
VSITVDSSDTIETLKDKIRELGGASPDTERWIFTALEQYRSPRTADTSVTVSSVATASSGSGQSTASATEYAAGACWPRLQPGYPSADAGQCYRAPQPPSGQSPTRSFSNLATRVCIVTCAQVQQRNTKMQQCTIRSKNEWCSFVGIATMCLHRRKPAVPPASAPFTQLHCPAGHNASLCCGTVGAEVE